MEVRAYNARRWVVSAALIHSFNWIADVIDTGVDDCMVQQLLVIIFADMLGLEGNSDINLLLLEPKLDDDDSESFWILLLGSLAQSRCCTSADYLNF